MAKETNVLADKSRRSRRSTQIFLEKYGEEISAKLKGVLSRHHPEVHPERVSLTVDKFMRHEFPLELERYFLGLTDKFNPKKHRSNGKRPSSSPDSFDSLKLAVLDELSHRSFGLGAKPPLSTNRHVERTGDIYTSKPQSVVNVSKERWKREEAEEGELENRPLEYHEFEELLEKERDAIATYMNDSSPVSRRRVRKAKEDRMKGEILLEEAYPELFDEHLPLNFPRKEEKVKLTEDEKLDNRLADYLEKIQDAASSGDDVMVEYYVGLYNEVAAKHGRPTISDSGMKRRIPKKGMTHVGRLGSFLSGSQFRIGE